MNPSYIRIRVPKDDALRRFAAWKGLAEVGPLVPTTCTGAIPLACDDDGQWRGQAVFVSEVGGWTVLNNLTGGLSAVSSTSWLALAGKDDLVFAGYNDAIGYGALVVITGGVVLQDVLFDPDSPESNINIDQRLGVHEPIKDWIGVASWVDDDELGFCEDGWLWVYEPIG
jgi:hypothetical protein